MIYQHLTLPLRFCVGPDMTVAWVRTTPEHISLASAIVARGLVVACNRLEWKVRETDSRS